MSFGTPSATKTAENNLGGSSNLALNNLFPAAMTAGGNQLASGAQNVTSGTNFLNTILGGNLANTTAALQPDISRITQGTTNNMGAINTLTPRGGGRSAALFGQSFAPQAQISNLFNTARTGAATALPQIGLQQQGLGTNLLGIGGQALGSANQANAAAGNLGLGASQQSLTSAAGLGSGLMALLTAPTSSADSSLWSRLFQ